MSKELIVGTYNLQCTKPNDSLKQAELLKRYGVQICSLQEINYKNLRFGNKPFNSLSAFENGKNCFNSVHFSSTIEFAYGHMGIGVVSELDVKNNVTFNLYSEDAIPEAIERMHKFYKEYNSSDPDTIRNLENYNKKHSYIEPRVVSRSEITLDEKNLAFYSTHLSFETTELRHAQLVQIRDMLKNDPADYVILAGDLNVDQNTMELDFLRKDFNLVNGNNGIWYDTFTGYDPNMNVNSVDNIIVSKNIEVVTTTTIQTDLSDHLPLIATLRLL